MPRAPNMPEVYTEARTLGPRCFPIGLHRLTNRAERPASRATVFRPWACVGDPAISGHVIMPCWECRPCGLHCGRQADFSAIRPMTLVTGFLARDL